jgi:hypothetical protein
VARVACRRLNVTRTYHKARPTSTLATAAARQSAESQKSRKVFPVAGPRQRPKNGVKLIESSTRIAGGPAINGTWYLQLESLFVAHSLVFAIVNGNSPAFTADSAPMKSGHAL